MRLLIASIGRMKAGVEKDLCDRYLDRIRKAGRSIGITSVEIIELTESKQPQNQRRKDEEAEALLKALPRDAVIVALDERGKMLDSKGFANYVDRHRTQAGGNIAFVLGGPDGHGTKVLQSANLKLAFGTMTWPHQLARVMLVEQVYRAITILSGHPYHRQ
ncbi:MAG: 23S rRNA (pseudouridine(1915)-N(3))-methyltransferase RlmH [Stappiaceae bacterium]